MSVHLQRELEDLRGSLLSLSGMVEESLARAVRALKNSDPVLSQEVIDHDQVVDSIEVELEEKCLKILALYQPVAVDLRFVIATLKINNDLERVADLAVNIAERARYLSGKDPIEVPFDFDSMAKKTRKMLKQSLDSVVKMDAHLAEEVCKLDEEVDDMNRQMYKTVYAEVKKNPNKVKQLIHYLSVSRNLERIADYATNICEDVIYMTEGSIVRHLPDSHNPDF